MSPRSRFVSSDGIVKIGVLTDLSGVYSAVGGQGAVEAVRMAADDFMKANPGIKVEVIDAVIRTRRISRRTKHANGSIRNRST